MSYKYSDYSLEQIKTGSYERLCNLLLSMAKNDKIKEKIQSILYEGGYGDFSVNTGLTKNNRAIEIKKRIGYAYLLVSNPETFDILVQNHINLFHGTNANALPNILKYGMQSVNEQSRKGIVTSTGEEWSRINGERDFISFTDDLDTALDYASFTPSKDNINEQSFSILIGMSSSSLKQLRTTHVHSDLPEVGIMDNIPLKHIKAIAVPEDKVEFVRKLVGNNEIIVTPINADERFYYVDSELGEVSFDVEEAQKLIKKKSQIIYDSEDLKTVAKTRKLSGIRKIYELIKEKMKNRGKYNEENSKNK